MIKSCLLLLLISQLTNSFHGLLTLMIRIITLLNMIKVRVRLILLLFITVIPASMRINLIVLFIILAGWNLILWVCIGIISYIHNLLPPIPQSITLLAFNLFFIYRHYISMWRYSPIFTYSCLRISPLTLILINCIWQLRMRRWHFTSLLLRITL